MLWNRGDREDYDIWSQLNDAKNGWDYDSLLEYFQRVGAMLFSKYVSMLTTDRVRLLTNSPRPRSQQRMARDMMLLSMASPDHRMFPSQHSNTQPASTSLPL